MPQLALYFVGHSDLWVNFRLSRESFSALMSVLGKECDHGRGPEIDTLVFLFWFASATSYCVVARAFDMPRATVHWLVHGMSAKIAALLYQVGRHPPADELPQLGACFARLARSGAFNRVVGAIDGCHVRVKPPAEDSACYFSRKLFYSVQLQAICDMCDIVSQFTMPGSSRRAPSIKSSPTLHHGGYTYLSQPICLMTPFRQPVLHHLQARFCCLSKVRCVLERSFEMLKT